MGAVMRHDLETVRRQLRRAMDTQGSNFRYNPLVIDRTPGGAEERAYQCSNTPQPDSSNPAHRITGCLVGTMMAMLNIPLGEAGAIEEYSDHFESDALNYLKVAQVHQDQGATWGEAVMAAEDTLTYGSKIL